MTVTPKPTFRQTLKSYGFDYKNLRYEYNVASSTLANALKGKQVGLQFAENLSQTTNIPFDALFDKKITEGPYAWETNSHIKRAVRSVLSMAKKQRLVQENYAKAEYINYPPKVKPEVKFMDDELSKKFFKTVMDYPDIKIKTAMMITLLTGFRREEICGLEWKDIDFERKLISVKRAVCYTPGFGVYEKVPKTQGSVRTIAVPDLLIEILSEYKLFWQDLVKSCGDYRTDTDKLFSNQRGGLINPGQIDMWLKKILKIAKIESYTLHSLRHTNITLQISAGVPISTVSKRAGHSRTSTTTDIYTHVIKNNDEMAASIINNIFNNEDSDE